MEERLTKEFRIFLTELETIDTISSKQRRLVAKIFDTLTLFDKYEMWPIPPYSPQESSQDISKANELLKFLRHEIEYLMYTGNYNKSKLDPWFKNLEIRDLQLLQGMRVTEGSDPEFLFFPDFNHLKELANQKYNEYLTELARARSKHSLRCEVRYWGEVTGSPTDQNEKANKYLLQLLENFTWWNVYGHFKHERVFEMRDHTGHGMRWDLAKEKFLGFVEPIDPNLGRTFFEYQ